MANKRDRVRLRDLLPVRTRRVLWSTLVSWLVVRFLRHVLALDVPHDVHESIQRVLEWLLGSDVRVRELAAVETVTDLRTRRCAQSWDPWDRQRDA